MFKKYEMIYCVDYENPTTYLTPYHSDGERKEDIDNILSGNGYPVISVYRTMVLIINDKGKREKFKISRFKNKEQLRKLKLDKLCLTQ